MNMAVSLPPTLLFRTTVWWNKKSSIVVVVSPKFVVYDTRNDTYWEIYRLLFFPASLSPGHTRTAPDRTLPPPLSFYVLLFFLLSPINLFALHWLLLSLLRDQLPWWIINNITLQRRAQYITAPCRSSPHRSCQCLLIRVNDHFVISVNERITACLLVVQIGRAQCQLKVTRDLLLN